VLHTEATTLLPHRPRLFLKTMHFNVLYVKTM